MLTNCPILVKDLSKIFYVYWEMGKPDAVIPPSWPKEYSTKINASSPLPVEFDNKFKMNTYFSVRFIPALTNIFYFNLSVGSIYNKI